jgi:hypothetical protein
MRISEKIEVLKRIKSDIMLNPLGAYSLFPLELDMSMTIHCCDNTTGTQINRVKNESYSRCTSRLQNQQTVSIVSQGY